MLLEFLLGDSGGVPFPPFAEAVYVVDRFQLVDDEESNIP